MRLTIPAGYQWVMESAIRAEAKRIRDGFYPESFADRKPGFVSITVQECDAEERMAEQTERVA